MKKIWLLVVFSVILAGVLISAPVLATNSTAQYTVNGIEIFAGINVGKDTIGATFVSQGSGSGLLANTNGILSASVNYIGPGPQINGNTIIGGTWTLTITTRGQTGTIMGKIIYGNITWTPSLMTNYGTTHMDLSITGGTGTYKGITVGNGSSFDGHDNHVSGLTIFGITVPTIDGTLTLNY